MDHSRDRYGNERGNFRRRGRWRIREAGIDDEPIAESERRYFGPRPVSEHGQGTPGRVSEQSSRVEQGKQMYVP
ncbi:hypothetical protein MLAC_40660 [Mycobacterium lacus]|uniref:Uncharacterized protein n=1 Tax=Mycobacterium lacus TaxID=169765 RepID=A0A7I7NQ58_9MYCO|nr:hypothetical protein MLAC_40660 [Mycobacterium lacus]